MLTAPFSRLLQALLRGGFGRSRKPGDLERRLEISGRLSGIPFYIRQTPKIYQAPRFGGRVWPIFQRSLEQLNRGLSLALQYRDAGQAKESARLHRALSRVLRKLQVDCLRAGIILLFVEQ